jgi:P-type E1-E2 ATPase
MGVITIDISGGPHLELEHLVLDLNGTLSERGALVPGVAERLVRLGGMIQVHVATADTFGTARELGSALQLRIETIAAGADKVDLVRRLGAQGVVAIGNGNNDAPMLEAVALGIAVIGAEGAATSALMAGDIVCRSITDALDLLLEPATVNATLRP